MKGAFVFVTILLAGCSIPPFLSDPSAPPPPSAGLTARQQAIKNYTDCVFGYAVSRADYNGTAYEVADAAIGACSDKLNHVYYQVHDQYGTSGALAYTKSMRDQARETAVTLIVEARNTRSPPSKPPISGT